MILKLTTLKRLIGMVLTTEDEEITCGECFKHVDAFAELTLAGKDAAEAYPLVQAHLDRCPDCHAEFVALLDAIRALEEEEESAVVAPSGFWSILTNKIKRIFGSSKA